MPKFRMMQPQYHNLNKPHGFYASFRLQLFTNFNKYLMFVDFTLKLSCHITMSEHQN